MKHLFLPLLLLSTGIFGQTGFTLSGMVTDCKTHELITGAEIKLVGSDGSSIQTATDVRGIYSFDAGKMRKNTTYVVTASASDHTHDLQTGKKRYFNSSERFKFQTSGSSQDFTFDCCLVPKERCTIMDLPVFYFSKNSSLVFSTADTLIKFSFVKEMLLDNPQLIIRIRAYCSDDEQNQEKLAVKRAETIRNLLIKEGINPEWLIIDTPLIVEWKNITPDKKRCAILQYTYSNSTEARRDKLSIPKSTENEE